MAHLVKNACNAGDLGSIPGLGRLPGEGNGYPLQYSCLGNSMDRGAWLATAYGIGKSRARLSDSHTHTHTVPKVKTVPRSVTTSHFSFLSTLYKQPIILMYPCFFLVKKKYCRYMSFLFFFLFFLNLILFFKLYIIVLVLPNIKMNPPQVYMCSPS